MTSFNDFVSLLPHTVHKTVRSFIIRNDGERLQKHLGLVSMSYGEYALHIKSLFGFLIYELLLLFAAICRECDYLMVMIQR